MGNDGWFDIGSKGSAAERIYHRTYDRWATIGRMAAVTPCVAFFVLPLVLRWSAWMDFIGLGLLVLQFVLFMTLPDWLGETMARRKLQELRNDGLLEMDD